MNFNTCVKQKRIFLFTILALFTSILVISFSLSISNSKKITAFADPTIDSVTAQINEVSGEIAVAENEYNKANMDKADAEEKVNECKASIQESENKIASLSNSLSTRAIYQYKDHSFSLLDAFLNVSDLSQLLTLLEVVDLVNEKEASMLTELKESQQKLEESKEELDNNYAIAFENEKKAYEVLQHYKEISSDLNAKLSQLNEAQKQAALNLSNMSGGGNSSNNNSGQKSGGGSSDYVPPVSSSDIVNRAYAEIGKPYWLGAVGPDAYDCSGLVSYAVTGSHTRLGTTWTFMGWPQCDPYPGCICTTSYHCGIYTGDGWMIHAPMPGYNVQRSPVQEDMIYVRPLV